MADKAIPLHLEDYDYHLPEKNIAYYPLAHRDKAKLLFYNKGTLAHYHFFQLPGLLPSQSRLFFNDTKVIAARIPFEKPSKGSQKGANIEIFLLSPLHPSREINKAMLAKKESSWFCLIGNQKKWKNDLILTKHLEWENQPFILSAYLEDRKEKIVRITWNHQGLNLAQVIEAAGKVPLPPYIQRDNIPEDKARYQTIYSRTEGAVAAPTAGLHFTETIMEQLTNLGIPKEYLTLHVGAGTFQPIKEKDIRDHPMHSEQIVINYDTIKKLLTGNFLNIPVGTTSMRTLESIYWLGCLLMDTHAEKVLDPESFPQFAINKLTPYQFSCEKQPGVVESLTAIKNTMETHRLNQITGSTEIFIYPGYQFKLCHGLITNFHLPRSTLLLLIAAFIGNDWKKVYKEALEHEYRFLSYGDTSLLLP